jgi:hypothetical protein
MTLTELLQLKDKYLKYDDLRAIAYCEKRWQEETFPTERWQLINFLEKMLQELKENVGAYPKVILLRKKEIQRGTYVIPQHSEKELHPSAVVFTSPAHPKIPKEWIDQAIRQSVEEGNAEVQQRRRSEGPQNAR